MSKIKYPSVKDKDRERRRIGQWFADQRIAHRKGQSSNDRTKKLESLQGWEWNRSNDSSTQNKQGLLKMARNKEPKPHYKTKLGRALERYIYESSKSHDSNFDKKIRALAPQWFRKRRKKQRRRVSQ